ncbi:beta-L-arabinofuranosidase domain-containing protein [Paenibacillus sp. Marseille-Q4541]|uniref:glycoside hydrolase family 127 protein n=1 Tax=Paenibacillus sp. Marseille-Q4541 TaxID=2831522 RepID=UPI001BA7F8F6|nr:beta-L-arabinofuranosidase domain-containing protein [Paenibacillus sp. Marseille-Q4541]
MNKLFSPFASQPLPLKSVTINDSYWAPYVDLVKGTVIPYQWDALNDAIPDAEPSSAIRNFRIAAGLEEGDFHGFVFQDSDLYKWLEAVGFSLSTTPDPDLAKVADGVIDLIAAAQDEDGYINTYFTVVAPDKRLTNLHDCHELYSAGHLIEAAVAYYEGTGKTKILDVAKRLADYIDLHFGPEPGKIRGYDGHQEIELALIKLHQVTGDDKYLNLSSFFIDERGTEPSFFHAEWESRGRTSYWTGNAVQKEAPSLEYWQAHKPVREQEVAVGHAVRAVYMYTAMADLAILKGDSELLSACKRLWNNIVHKQMYINGSIGSTHHGEAFTFDYDLPNDTNYSETCASIGLIFFARRMIQAEMKSEYADVMERALYNTVTAGIAGDGKHYFYVNPMEVWPEASKGNPGKHHVKPVRQKWYGCACCPPNVARLISSLGSYIFTSSDDTLYTHLYIGNETQVALGSSKATIKLTSELPWNGLAGLQMETVEGDGLFTLAVRVPSWSEQISFTLNGEKVTADLIDGYAYFKRTWEQGDQLAIHFDMQPKRLYAHSKVRANAGRVALQRGPLVYCLEEMDNVSPLTTVRLPADAEIREVTGVWNDEVVFLEMDGIRQEEITGQKESLYSTAPPKQQAQRLLAIPYTLWGNRTPGEMQVWIREQS